MRSWIVLLLILSMGGLAHAEGLDNEPHVFSVKIRAIGGLTVEGGSPLMVNGQPVVLDNDSRLTGGGGNTHASPSAEGISFLSTAPVTATHPIAVGDNDSRFIGAPFLSKSLGGTVTASTTFTSVQVTSLTNSSLPANRVVYSTIGGQQTSSNDLFYDGTNLTLGGGGAQTPTFTMLNTGSTLNGFVVDLTNGRMKFGQYFSVDGNGIGSYSLQVLSQIPYVSSTTNQFGQRVLLGSSNLTFDGTTLTSTTAVFTNTLTGNTTATSLANSSLTANRVMYSAAGGRETDSSNLTFDGSSILSIGGQAAVVTNDSRFTGSPFLSLGSGGTVTAGTTFTAGLISSAITDSGLPQTSSSSNPVLLSSTLDGGAGGALLNFPFGMQKVGNNLFATTANNALEVLNVSNPAVPVHLASLTNGTGGALLNNPKGLVIVGNFAYIASFGSNALEIVDISNPAAPVHAGSLTNGTGGALLNGPQNLKVVGNYAYIVSFTSSALEIVDISNPAAPVHAASLANGTGGALLNNPADIVIQGNYAFITPQGSAALEVVDITNPLAPFHAGSLTNAQTGANSLQFPRSLILDSNKLYITNFVTPGGNIEIADVTVPTTPTHVGTISGGNVFAGAALDSSKGLVKSGNYLYVASGGTDAIEIIDVTTPAAPVHFRTIFPETNGPYLTVVESLYLSGSLLFAGNSSAPIGLSIFSLSGTPNSGTLYNDPTGLLKNAPNFAFDGTTNNVQNINTEVLKCKNLQAIALGDANLNRVPFLSNRGIFQSSGSLTFGTGSLSLFVGQTVRIGANQTNSNSTPVLDMNRSTNGTVEAVLTNPNAGTSAISRINIGEQVNGSNANPKRTQLIWVNTSTNGGAGVELIKGPRGELFSSHALAILAGQQSAVAADNVIVFGVTSTASANERFRISDTASTFTFKDNTSASTFNVSNTAGNLFKIDGTGAITTSGTILAENVNASGFPSIQIVNTSVAAATGSEFIAGENNSNQRVAVTYRNSGTVVSGLINPKQGVISTGSQATGGMLIEAGTGDLVLGQGGTATTNERLRFSTTTSYFTTQSTTASSTWAVKNSAGTNLLLIDGTGAASFTDTVTMSALRVTGLTVARIPYVTAGSLIQDSSSFIWDQANTRLGIGSNASTPTLPTSGGLYSFPLDIYKDFNGTAVLSFVNPNAGVNAGTFVALSEHTTFSGKALYFGWNNTNLNFGAGYELIAGPSGELISTGTLTLGSGSEDGSGDMRFATGGYATANEKMRLTYAGNLGIGTTTPGANLDVNGATNTTTLTIGGTTPLTGVQVGTTTLSSGTVTISSITITASSRIFLTQKTAGGVTGIRLQAPSASRTTGVGSGSFVIQSVDTAGSVVVTDSSTVDWEVVN